MSRLQKMGKTLQTHHMVSRSSGGTDRADNLIIVCTDCHTHAAHQPGGVLYKWQEKPRKVPQHKEPPFMNALRRRMSDRYLRAHFVSGSVARPAGKALCLEKSHVNDAVALSGTDHLAEPVSGHAVILQARAKKRWLHEATPGKGRKEKNRSQKREARNTASVDGFHISGKVIATGRTGYITGFTGNNAYIRGAGGCYAT